MCWSVTVLLLAHLGATLSGAWRASQPRLQFTHSGKTGAFHFLSSVSSLSLLSLSNTSVALIVPTPPHTQTGDVNFKQLLVGHFSYFINAHTVIRPEESKSLPLWLLLLHLCNHLH